MNYELITKRGKKKVDASYTMNLAKGGYDIVFATGEEKFMTVADFNKKYEMKMIVDKIEEPKEEAKEEPKKETKPKGAKHIKEVLKEEQEAEAPSKTIEAPSKPSKAKTNTNEPSPIVEMVKKAFKEFKDQDENLLLDKKTKVTNFKYKGRILVEIHYQKKGVKCLFNEKGLSQENLNLCSMVNPMFKWSTNAEYKIYTESQIEKAMNMLKECYDYRKGLFEAKEVKKEEAK